MLLYFSVSYYKRCCAHQQQSVVTELREGEHLISWMWFSEKHTAKMNNFSFLCEVCGFGTKDKKTASNHKQEHTQQEHFKCDECNKTIKRRKKLCKTC